MPVNTDTGLIPSLMCLVWRIEEKWEAGTECTDSKETCNEVKAAYGKYLRPHFCGGYTQGWTAHLLLWAMHSQHGTGPSMLSYSEFPVARSRAQTQSPPALPAQSSAAQPGGSLYVVMLQPKAVTALQLKAALRGYTQHTQNKRHISMGKNAHCNHRWGRRPR